MGSWGPAAFANDAALDAVGSGQLLTVEGILAALAAYLPDTNGDRAYDSIEPAYGAAEIVAAVRSGDEYWQSAGTTLGAGEYADDYFPEEVVALLESEDISFDDFAAEQALEVIACLEAEVDKENWRAPQLRLKALAETRARLLLKPPRGWHDVEPGVRERLSSLAG